MGRHKCPNASFCCWTEPGTTSISGRATQILCDNLGTIRREVGADFVIVNAENVCLGAGNGLSADWAMRLLTAGADVLTGGNHSWRQRCLYNLLDDRRDVLRPANFHPSNPGQGHTIINVGAARVLVMNVSGQQHLWYDNAPSCAFDAVEGILERTRGQYDLSVLDMHGETTSEKAAMALYFDGVVDIIFGTHTHVPTADECVLPGGTGFITDIGMCGAIHSALGVEPQSVIAKLRTGMPQKFKPADGPIQICGAVFAVESGRVISVNRYNKIITK